MLGLRNRHLALKSSTLSPRHIGILSRGLSHWRVDLQDSMNWELHAVYQGLEKRWLAMTDCHSATDQPYLL